MTNGTFSIDGEDFDVENNIWIVGDDTECIVIDAAHEAAPILAGVDGRRVVTLVCTHGHNDHINVAVEVAEAAGAPIAIHADDRMLWDVVNPTRPPDFFIADGDSFTAGGVELVALHTPGHSPGGVSLYSAANAVVFSGDTLFNGGIGRTDLWGGDFNLIKSSIRERLLTLPDDAIVVCGHGPDTTIGAVKRQNPFIRSFGA